MTRGDLEALAGAEHLCVMGGSACHFAAVYLYVTPA